MSKNSISGFRVSEIIAKGRKVNVLRSSTKFGQILFDLSLSGLLSLVRVS